MKSRSLTAVWVVLAILILAMSIRVWKIGYESYWLDEAISVRQSQLSLGYTLSQIQDDVHPPLYGTALNLWIHVFGVTETATRILSALFGVISVYLIYLLGKHMFSKRVAVISALFLSLSPFAIYYSQETRMYALVMMLSLLSTLLFYLYIKSQKTGYLPWYCLASCALIYTHYFGFIVILCQNLAYLLLAGLKNRPFRWIASQAAVAASFLPWLPSFLHQITLSSQYSWLPKPTLLVLGATFVQILGGVLPTILFMVAVLLVILRPSIIRTSGKRSEIMLLSISFLIPVILVYAVSVISTPLLHVRYLLFILPPALLLSAYLIDCIPVPQLIRAGAVVIILGLYLSASLVQADRLDKDNWKLAASYLKTNVGKTDYVYIHPFYHQSVFIYYYAPDCFTAQDVFSCSFARHNVLSVLHTEKCCNASTLLTHYGLPDRLSENINGTVWLLNIRSVYTDPGNELYRYVGQNKVLVNQTSFGDIIISKFI